MKKNDMKEVDSAKFEVTSITESPSPMTNSVLYDIEVEGKVGRKKYELKYEVEYRPTVEFQMNNREKPTKFLLIHLESEIRNDFLSKGVSIKQIDFI